MSMKCPNMEACTLFPVFQNVPFLKIWQINYCESDYSRCARFSGLCKGKTVPTTLLPNGKHLPVINNSIPPEDPTK